MTRANLPDVTAVPALAADLGCDYAVPQPISLFPDHALHNTLALTPDHVAALARAYSDLYDSAPPGVLLPSGSSPS